MNSLKKLLTRWFKANFSYVREDKSSWAIKSKSSLGCLLLLPVFLIFLGCAIFLLFKIYPIIFSTLITRLGIASGLGIPLLIACFFGSFINLPIFVPIAKTRSTQQAKFEPFPKLLRWLCFPLYGTKYKPYVYLNVSGGLIPIVLALYQFYRVRPASILIVTAVVSLMNYFLVVVKPGRGIFIRQSRLQSIAIIAALLAMVIVDGGENRLDVPVAFAGGVLGTTIGADLLHLKDVRPEKAAFPLSIGGAGFDDGIALLGLYALILTEWLPAVFAWLSRIF